MNVNLRDLYPDFYKTDYTIEVTDDVAAVLREFDRTEATYQRQVRRYKAYYSFSWDNGIEKSVLFSVQTPEEIYERKLTVQQLHDALKLLPHKQYRRIYAFFFLGMTKTAIAESEGVDRTSVSEAIHRGLQSLEKYLKNLF